MDETVRCSSVIRPQFRFSLHVDHPRRTSLLATSNTNDESRSFCNKVPQYLRRDATIDGRARTNNIRHLKSRRLMARLRTEARSLIVSIICVIPSWMIRTDQGWCPWIRPGSHLQDPGHWQTWDERASLLTARSQVFVVRRKRRQISTVDALARHPDP